MTPQQIDAMKLALEALELLTDTEQTFGALDYGDNAITAIKEALAQPEQEPVAWMKAGDTEWSISFFEEYGYVPLYIAPPQRKPLSFNEITAIEEKVYMRTTHKGRPAFEYANALIRAIEEAHGIKEDT